MIKQLRLFQFRNFKHLDLEFERGVNAIIGPNAIGKTTILEAIHLLSIGRSFRTTKLSEIIKKGESIFSISALFEKNGVDQTLSISFNGIDKQIKHNETSYKSFSHLLGLLPTVVYSPFDIEIIHGGPSERRRFLNILIAQSNPTYVHHITRYAKGLAQRNALLQVKSVNGIEVWEDELIKSATFIQEKRAQTIDCISLKTKEMYRELSKEQKEIALLYKPSGISTKIFERNRDRELYLGYTIAGPHRDDIEIACNGLPAKNYASEGQKRTIIASLKLAETETLENAILLIDDFGIHLDEQRKEKFEEKIQAQNQLFLTSPTYFKRAFLCSLGAHPHQVHSFPQ